MSTTLDRPIPLVAVGAKSAAAHQVLVLARAWAVRLGARMARMVVASWRYARSLYAAVRLGLIWARFCGSTGLADQRKQVDRETGKVRAVLSEVPQLRELRVSQHGWSQVVKLRPGQSLSTYLEVCTPLRHAARVQTVKAVELEERPGFVELRVLRRDPLNTVTERPRALDAGRFVVGSIENGDPMVVDFGLNPHLLMCGGTGSGKSGLLGNLLSAIATTDALVEYWDLKWGIEAEPWRPRISELSTTQAQVKDSTARILDHTAGRAELLKKLGVRSVGEAEALGVRLRRVYLVVDEVAEVTLDHGEKGAGGAKLVDLIAPEVLSIVQRVRAFGVHVILCGQRFGSDLGPKITAIRAQVPGRVCLGVNDIETARMVLPGLDPDVHRRVLGISRAGLGVIPEGQDWRYGRGAFQLPAEIRATAAATAHNAISWEGLAAADLAAVTEFEGR